MYNSTCSKAALPVKEIQSLITLADLDKGILWFSIDVFIPQENDMLLYLKRKNIRCHSIIYTLL